MNLSARQNNTLATNEGDALAASLGRGGRLCVAIVTFRRLTKLQELLDSIRSQTLTPTRVIVFDNAGDPQVQAACERPDVEYLSSKQNLGPAGGTAEVMRRFQDEFSSGDWLLRIDDDRPLSSPELLAELMAAAQSIRETDPMVGGVGLAGAVLDRRKFRLMPPASATPMGPLGIRASAVDYLASSHLPMWPWEALSRSGVMDEVLFFGLTEVEFGLRQRSSGLNLYEVDIGQESFPLRSERGRFSFLSESVTWRRYYSLRNGIVLARRYSGLSVALWHSVRVGVAQPCFRLLVLQRQGTEDLKLTARALVDGWLGRLGRRVDPFVWAAKNAELTERSEMPTT